MTLTMALVFTISAQAFSYSSARSRALFLTDKMAYELNLTDDQYDACYEINLDYMLNISVQGDLFGNYWSLRNQELSYVLSPSQYRVFLATEYFYRPISWVSNKFHFLIYDRYPKNRFFRSAPRVYDTYRGGNRTYNHSAYQGRSFIGKDKNNKVIDRQPANRKSNVGSNNTPQLTRREAIKESRNNTERQRAQFSQRSQSQNNAPAGGNSNRGSFGGSKKR